MVGKTQLDRMNEISKEVRAEAVESTNYGAIEHTLSSFLHNPSGQKGNSAQIQAASLMTGKFLGELNELLKIRKPSVYVSVDAGNVYLLVKLPSASSPKVTYDVVIKFIDGADKTDLSQCKVKFFSNAMSYVYTYAYAFNNAELDIDELSGKLPKESTSEYSKVRNPDLLVNLEKTITQSILYLRQINALKKSYWFTKKIARKALFDKIASFNNVKKVYDEEKVKESALKKQAKRNAKQAPSPKKVVEEKKELINPETNRPITNSKVNNKINNKVQGRRVNSKVSSKTKK